MAPVDEARAERLVLQAAKVIYGGFDNWEVRGIRNLRIGVPLGGLTVDVVTASDDGEVLVLEGVWDGALWIDRVVQESREDAKKGGKGGKRQPRKEKPKCTKGRVCGMTCIRREKANGEATRCRFDPPPLVEQALNTASSIGASSGGGGAGGGQGYPTSLPADHVVTTSKRITAARLDAALDAIDSPGARERVGMFRAFVKKTGVQAVFVKTDGDMDAHVELARQGLKTVVAVGPDGDFRSAVTPWGKAAGFTGRDFDHVVINTDDSRYKVRENIFTVDGLMLEDGVSRVLAGAEDDSSRSMQWSVPGSMTEKSRLRTWDAREFTTYLHEIGHQIHFKAGEVSPPMDVKGSATDYGATNEQEWFAEHFALWMLDAPGYEQLDPVGAQFIRDSLISATENPVSIEELMARGNA